MSKPTPQDFANIIRYLKRVSDGLPAADPGLHGVGRVIAHLTEQLNAAHRPTVDHAARERFAVAALPVAGSIALGLYQQGQISATEVTQKIAQFSYELADAMLDARGV